MGMKRFLHWKARDWPDQVADGDDMKKPITCAEAGKLGGETRAKHMTAKQRSASASKAAKARHAKARVAKRAK